MKQQKWSGVKLTKKELEEVRKEEKLEIFAEIAAFLIVIGIVVFGFCIISFLLEAIK